MSWLTRVPLAQPRTPSWHWRRVRRCCRRVRAARGSRPEEPYTRDMEHQAAALMEALVRHGYLVILLIMIVEEAGVPSPIPGDGLLLFAGYLSSTGRLTLTKSLVTIVFGALVGATILYWVARLGGRALVHRYGRFIRLDDRKLDQLRHLFERLGPVGPGVARLIPGLRIYTSALAGLADISYPVFL